MGQSQILREQGKLRFLKDGRNVGYEEYRELYYAVTRPIETRTLDSDKEKIICNNNTILSSV